MMFSRILVPNIHHLMKLLKYRIYYFTGSEAQLVSDAKGIPSTSYVNGHYSQNS